MSFADCLKNAVDGGEIGKAEAERLERDFNRFRDRFAGNSEVTADAEAKAALLDYLKAETEHQRRKAKLAMQSIQRIASDLKSWRSPTGETDIGAAALDMLEHFGQTGPGSRFDSVEGRRKAIIGAAQTRMEKSLIDFQRGMLAGDLGRHNKASLDNVVREAFGQDTGDAVAKHLAKVWSETAEWLRQRFNAAGGAIGKLENWGLPQHHDARALLARGREAWKGDITPLLDRSRITNPLSGRPVTEGEFDRILDDIWENIVTDGWNKKEPKRQTLGRGALANQRAEHRVLTFRDPDAWMTYQKAYGGGADPFATMMGHINMMARDIAAMEVLGPNPSGTIEWMKQAVMKDAAGKGGPAQSRANSRAHRLDTVWGSIRGTLETPVNTTAAAWFAGGRNLITASVLGSASLSSISDLGTQKIARAFAGIERRAIGAQVLPDIMRAFAGADRREAVSAGLILDSAMHVFHAQARYVGTLDGPGWTSFIADRVLTLSGLTPWTQAGRHAFGLAFMETLARNADTAFADLPDALRNTLNRHGIDATQWRQIATVPRHEATRGLTLLRQNEIRDRLGDKIADRYLSMLLAETEYAVPSGAHRSRTALLDQNQPGTFLGEAIRSLAMFKSFTAVMVFLHGRRIHGEIAPHMKGGMKNLPSDLLTAMTGRGAFYAGSLLVSTTLFGALAMQLKSMAAGRDPRDMTEGTFWQAAMLQGGGLGIFGDFLFADLNRYGAGLPQTLAGPVIGSVDDVVRNLFIGNLAQLAAGEETKFGRELINFARGNIPGSNIFYIRLAWERMVLDQLQYLVDPEANKAFKRKQQFFDREFGQQYFWKPGEALPQRGPDLSAAVPG